MRRVGWWVAAAEAEGPRTARPTAPHEDLLTSLGFDRGTTSGLGSTGTWESAVTAVPDPFPGEFRLLRSIGAGAFGRVWLAEDLRLGRLVALKTLKIPSSSARGSRALAALERDAVQVVVQVDGRVRTRLVVSPEIAEERLRTEALADEKVRPWLQAREVARVVVVPGRLVNIVTRGSGSPA